MPRRDLEKNREYQRKWWQANKETQKERVKENTRKFKEKVAALKMFPCMDCGFTPVHHSQMDWDHIQGDKLSNVSQLSQLGSLSKVLEEVSKCELVCANCHRLRTATRNGR